MQEVHEQILSYRWNDNACLIVQNVLGGLITMAAVAAGVAVAAAVVVIVLFSYI